MRRRPTGHPTLKGKEAWVQGSLGLGETETALLEGAFGTSTKQWFQKSLDRTHLRVLECPQEDWRGEGLGCRSLWGQGHWCLGPQRILICVSSPKRLPFWHEDLAPPNRMQDLVLSPSEQTTSRIGIQPHLKASRMPKVVSSSQLTINTPLDMALPTKGTRSKPTHRGQEPVPSTRKPAQTQNQPCTPGSRHQKQELQPCSSRNLYVGQEATVRTGHGTTDQFKLGKEYVKDVYCHPAYFTHMQSTSCEMLG